MRSFAVKSVWRADRLFDRREEWNPTLKPNSQFPLSHPFHFRFALVNNNINHCFHFWVMIYFSRPLYVFWFELVQRCLSSSRFSHPWQPVTNVTSNAMHLPPFSCELPFNTGRRRWTELIWKVMFSPLVILSI